MKFYITTDDLRVRLLMTELKRLLWCLEIRQLGTRIVPI